MNRLLLRCALLVAVAACAAGPAAAADAGGRLVGFVEDARGTPVSGALISLFGNGLAEGGLIAFSDASGRFVLPTLPAGSYTLRALGGRLRAQARQVTVLPDQESIFSVSLFAPEESGDEEEIARLRTESAAERELKWLVRHKRRSILEDRSESVGDGEEVTQVALAPARESELPLEGAFEVVAESGGFGSSGDDDEGTPLGGLGMVRLGGRLGDSMSWKLSGLASESETSSWRMAAEFEVEPDAGQQILAGAGYGSRWLTPLARDIDSTELESRSVGVIFAEERWEVTQRFRVSAGARYSYIGFLADRNHVDPSAALEFEANRRTRLRGAFTTRTLPPGGDLLTLSTLASSPAIAYAIVDDGLRAERLARYEVSISHDQGPVRLAARVFHEGLSDPYVNAFLDQARSLRISNAPSMTAHGMGVTVGRSFGQAVDGSVSYTYGRSSRQAGMADAPGALAFEANDFHDFVARLHAVLRATDTRIVAFCRLNTLAPDAEGPGTEADRFTRFDVQLSQGIPFIGELTRADWELLLAYRNLFYETSEGGTLDELSVVNPPTRMLGGITVRF